MDEDTLVETVVEDEQACPSTKKSNRPFWIDDPSEDDDDSSSDRSPSFRDVARSMRPPQKTMMVER